MKSIHTTDVLVIGAGLAGMQAALHAPDHHVTLVTAGQLGRSGASPRAKGGIAVPVSAADHPGLHAADTLDAGAGLCHHGAVQIATEEGYRRLRGLIALGVDFDRSPGGELALGREAAHSRRRIVRAGGDQTGAAICSAVADGLARATHIVPREHCRAVALIGDGTRVDGAWLMHADGHLEAHLARATVLATGGLGQLFAHTSNPAEARGEGLILAHEAGASLADLEFVQFHPTALDVDANPQPLLSEAIRGEGAVLIDDTGERFMPAEHELAELAPRDVVARAIWRRRQAGRAVLLDVRGIDDFSERFPGAAADCRAHGLDPTRDPLPVVPAAHYHMGGVAVDLDGRTSVDGLWACGEVAATGLHGANRLASNSLLEALVFGARAGRDIARRLGHGPYELPDLDSLTPPEAASDISPSGLARLRQIMWRDVGLARSADGLHRALAELDELAAGHRLVSLASLIALAALRRRESRGAHYRVDFPQTREDWRRRLVFSGAGLGDEAVDADRAFGVDGGLRRLPY